MLHEISGNILDSNTKYIAHQCNCITVHAQYLAKDIFEKYPYANVYRERKKSDIPGSIIIKGNGNDERFIIALFGQYFPGKIKYQNSNLDGENARKNYFYNSLKQILTIQNLESISFPYGIGCGAAGGDWKFYKNILEKFSEATTADVFIYKLI